jgi:hypothetical protein
MLRHNSVEAFFPIIMSHLTGNPLLNADIPASRRRISMKRVITPAGGMTADALGAAFGAAQHALRTTIEAIPSINLDDPAWFDELESRLIREAKGAVTEGIGVETEAQILKFGIDVLQATLDACRITLGLAKDDGEAT